MNRGKRYFCTELAKSPLNPARRRIGRTRADKVLRQKRIPKDAYQLVSSLKYHDLPEFPNQSKEQNRSEEELKTYFSDLYEYLQLRNDSMPVDSSIGTLEEIEEDPFFDKSEKPWEKLLAHFKETAPDEVEKNKKSMEQLINFAPLDFKTNEEPPKLKPDSEYPAWLWNVSMDREIYSLTDLSKIPFENLTMREKWRLIGVWRKTMMCSNNMWRNTLGRNNGRVRTEYDDPWPEPITRQDYWGEIEEQEDLYENEEIPRDKRRPLRLKNRWPDVPKPSTRTPGHLYNHVDRSQNMVAFFSKPMKWSMIRDRGPGSLKSTMNAKNKNNIRRR